MRRLELWRGVRILKYIIMFKYLFIIGNGFDLAHGLQTSYSYFVNYCNKNNLLINNNFMNIIRIAQTNNNWSDIEYLYYLTLLNYNNEQFYIKNSFHGINLYDEFDEVKNELSKYLINEQEKIKEINSFNNLFSKFNNEESFILNFNYTNTVFKYIERNKNIELINIHGELQNENNPIIFGFAANDKQTKVLIDKNDNEMMRNIKKINYKLTLNHNTINKWLYLKEKDTEMSIIVFVIGHSCGISDLLILDEIFNSPNIVSIIPLYYKDKEGYLSTCINIDRIIDDYSKDKEVEKKFPKLLSFPDCFKIIQHNSSEEDKIEFEKYYNNILDTNFNEILKELI